MDVFTYRDAVEHLIDMFQFDDSEDRLLRNARRAVTTVYRDLPNITRWRYLQREFVLTTDASYSTGTIAYDHTGGTYEREVTLSGGTWPTNASRGVLVISDVPYLIDRRISDTVITLKANNNPGADVAASTTFTYYRAAYELPSVFRKLGKLWDTENERELTHAGHDAQVGLNTIYYDTPDTPWNFTLRGSDNVGGRMAVVFIPPPDAARTYRGSYEASPRELKVENYATGTVTTSGTTVTLSTGTFPESVSAGTIIRFSDSATAPTSLYGNPADVSNTYYAQREVVVRTSGTVVSIDSALESDQTSVAYTVSDPIDLEPGAMLSAFLRGIEAEYARVQVLDSRDKYKRDYMQSIRLAMEADQRATYASSHAAYDPFTRANITTT